MLPVPAAAEGAPRPRDDSKFPAFLAAVGERIRRRRERAGWTQEDLADRAGLTHRMVQYCEAGARTPSLKTLWRLARAFGVSPARFLPEAPFG